MNGGKYLLEDILKKWKAYEVDPMILYSDMFHFGEGYIQMNGEEKGQFKANPIGYYRMKGKNKGHYRILFEDTFEEILEELQAADDFAIINGITYFGRKNVQSHASKMFAMIFDIDGVTDKSLNAFLSGAIVAEAYPVPNYVILSGNGIHLYYIFEKPIALYPYTKLQLKEMKYALTELMWNKYTSTLDKKQFQGINQGFRVVGGRVKPKAVEQITRAFHLDVPHISIAKLNSYVPHDSQVDETKIWKESKFSLEDAKKKFPEWYQKVIIEGNRDRTYWNISEKVHGDNPFALYDWWKDKIKKGASYHHRYFAIMCLAIYGIKCRKDYEEVRQDALSLIPFLNAINPDEPFTEEDCKAALECYDLRYCTFPIKDIVKISGIPIEKNKRNGRKQAVHLSRVRVLQDFDDPDRNWINKDGRPKKENIVQQWQADNPDGRKIDCIRATGLSKPTVYKWWR